MSKFSIFNLFCYVIIDLPTKNYCNLRLINDDIFSNLFVNEFDSSVENICNKQSELFQILNNF